MGIITLTTDFGTADAYVAQMKAVMLGVNPSVTIVDITHEIPKFDLTRAAFVLVSAVPYFPEGTIHVAVVDPEVGGARKPIVIETERAIFVGPDNGVLALAAQKLGVKAVFEIKKDEFIRPQISSTFHGRDIFAPTAAQLSKGRSPSDVGPEISDFQRPIFATPKIQNGRIECQVIHVDAFGNVISNVPAEQALSARLTQGRRVRLRTPKFTRTVRFVRTYVDSSKGDFCLLIGSHGFIEIGMTQGNAARRLRLKPSDKINLQTVD